MLKESSLEVLYRKKRIYFYNLQSYHMHLLLLITLSAFLTINYTLVVKFLLNISNVHCAKIKINSPLRMFYMIQESKSAIETVAIIINILITNINIIIIYFTTY